MPDSGINPSPNPKDPEKKKWAEILTAVLPVIGIIIALLSFIFGSSGHQSWKWFGTNSVNHVVPTNPAVALTAPPGSATNFVTIRLPSTHLDLDIFVDNRPAEIVDKTLSGVSVRIVGPEKQYKFRFEKNSTVVKQVMFPISQNQTNQTFSPFAY